MSGHTHAVFVEGCFRCDLSRHEMTPDQRPSEIAEKFRAALLSVSEGDDLASRLALGSLLASAEGDPELDQVVRDTFTACDKPVVKRAADWGRELADYERALRERIAAEIEADAMTPCAACLAADGTENRWCNHCAGHRHWFARAARLVRPTPPVRPVDGGNP